MTHAMTYWSISSKVLVEEAKLLGLGVEIINKDKNLYYISSSTRKVLFKATDFGENSALGFKLCVDKELTYNILEKHNFPIAKSYYIKKIDFGNFKEHDIQTFHFPLVIKPYDEGHGNGVMMEIKSFEELYEKLKNSFDIYETMIVQEQIGGDEVRVLVVLGEVYLAINRIPAHVIGNGKFNISQLIEEENKNPARGKGYDNFLAHISTGHEVESFLRKRGLELKSIPNDGEWVQLRGNSNLGTGGTMKEVTGKLHENTKNMCIAIAREFGLGICGVDIIMKDFSQDVSTGNGIILEVNATPGIGGYRELTSVNVGKKILKKIFSIS